MLRKSVFFDFLNRRDDPDFERFLESSVEDEDYINWNHYALPFHWGNPAYEYDELRHRCAIFDSTAFQKIRIRGCESGALLDHTVTRPVSSLPDMRATYVILCNDDGTIKDDAILFKVAGDDFLLMPSDMDHTPYLQSLCDRFGFNDVSFTNESDLYTGMAVQGPLSARVLTAMGFAGVENQKPFELRDYSLEGHTIRIGRVGFTADLGYECWLSVDATTAFQQAIVSARDSTGLDIPGYGLRTLETCRLEGGFVVAAWDFATELDPQPGFERTPDEVGLSWIVRLDGAKFVGRGALVNARDEGPRYVFRQFTIDQQLSVDDGTPAFATIDGHDHEIGLIACSSWSWGLDAVIGNVSISAEFSDIRDAWIQHDNGPVVVTLTTEPLMTLDRRNAMPAAL